MKNSWEYGNQVYDLLFCIQYICVRNILFSPSEIYVISFPHTLDRLVMEAGGRCCVGGWGRMYDPDRDVRDGFNGGTSETVNTGCP